MGEERYLYSDEKDEVEFSRLTLQASIIDPVTIRHLETIGVAEGWKCLEVGAGAGSIAQWLSKRVGPSGKVVATDIDLRFLGGMSAPNLEVRRHDILKDDLEMGEYDLVHSRKVLEHLPEPEKGLRRMADCLRPRGWLLIEDRDHGSKLSAGVTGAPSGVLLATMTRACADYVLKRRIADPYFGRRVRGLVEQLGFEEVGQEGWTHMVHGGDSMARADAADGLPAFKAMIAEGLLTQEQFESLQRLFPDPAFSYPGSTMFCAWGRKPEAQRRE